MKPTRTSTSLSVWIFGLGKLLFYGTLIVSCAISALLFHLKEKYESTTAGVAAVVVFLAGVCLSLFVVPQVISRMKADQTLFLGAAVAQTFHSYVMLASFLPIAGPFFGRLLRGEKSKDPFTDDRN